MTRVLVFLVEIVEVEDKIWREIELTSRRTVADLAYAILASFRSEASHLYDIAYKGKVYDCGIDADMIRGEMPFFADDVRLGELDLELGDTMVMKYDFGLNFQFRIKFLGEKGFRQGSGNGYPKVTAGAGWGMVDDVTNEELKEAVEDIDINGEIEYQTVSLASVESKAFDYKKFDLKLNDKMTRREFRKIKEEYES